MSADYQLIDMAGSRARVRRSRFGIERIRPTAQQVRDLRDMARLVGADPEFLIQYLQSMRREAGRNTIVTRPQMRAETGEQVRARELAGRIAGLRFGRGQQVDLSREALVRSVASWSRIIGNALGHYAGPLTSRGLDREARRLGVDTERLRQAFVAYAMFRGNERDAQIAVQEASGGNERIAAWASAAGRYARETRHEGGAVEYWYRAADRPRIRLAYMEATGARPVRTAPTGRARAEVRRESVIEIALRRRITSWGGSYTAVRRELERLLQMQGPDRDRAIMESMRSRDLDRRLAVGVLEVMEGQNLAGFDDMRRLTGQDRVGFMRALGAAGRYA